MANEFSGKIAVITGGSRGIGKATAKAFAREGAEVVIAASSPDNLKAAADDIATVGRRPDIVAGDLGTPAGCDAVFDHVARRFGRCDILVNSAGATRAGPYLESTEAEWQAGFALKFFAAVRLCRAFWPMLRDAGGKVVNIGGGAGRTPPMDFLIGASVNAAMGNFTKGLSKLGMKDGVNVNLVTPGLTRTERVHELMRRQAAERGISLDAAVAEAAQKQGIRRVAEAEDLAVAVLFLCTPGASQIQGANINVDGGATPGYY